VTASRVSTNMRLSIQKIAFRILQRLMFFIIFTPRLCHPGISQRHSFATLER